MAYVPPHKRNLNGKERVSPTPVPDSLVPRFRKNLDFRENNRKVDKGKKIVYADDCVSKWFAFGLEDNGKCPPHIRLKPITSESECVSKTQKRLVLVNDDLAKDEYSALNNSFVQQPWEFITTNVHEDLLTSYEVLRDRMKEQGSEKIVPTLVARLGKFVFYDLSENANDENSPVEEATLRQMRRSLYTSLTSSYIEEIRNEIVHKIGLAFLEEKEIYHVKLSDKRRADSTLSCKCRVDEDNKLLFYKVELNQVRQFVADVSCLDKSLDLRLMLCSKRIVTTLTDDEDKNIRDLISTAVLDSNVKGGLRWPMGKTSFDQRYHVVGVWHTTTKTYKNEPFKLKVRRADRFDFRSGTETAANEAYLKLKAVNSELQEENFDKQSVRNEMKENLRLIWDNFLCCECFLP